MGFIYKISNDFDSNVYIGQTVKTIEGRWKQHISASKNPKMHISYAIRKYGVEHFTIEQIEECDDSIINEREMYWISYYDSYHNGYNSNLGGSGAKCFGEDIIQAWYNGMSMQEIISSTGLSRRTVTDYLYAVPEINEKIHEEIRLKNYTEVSQYSTSGEYIETYKSIADASRAIGVAPNKLNCALSKGYKAAYGYQWRVGSSKENIGPVPKPRRNRFRIVQLSSEMEYIADYESISYASKHCGYSYTVIGSACKTGRLFQNCYWMYYDNYIREMEDCQVAEAS